MNKFRPVTMIVLDGWGESPEIAGNAIKKANIPTIDTLNRYYPKTFLQASGISVGLPWGECGNSEVGHQSMGAGRVIYQNLPKITLAIEDGSFFKNEAFLKAVTATKEDNSALHLVGLISDGGVHSDINHLFALLELSKDKNLKKVFIHAITDGRDTSPKIAKEYIKKIQEKIKQLEIGKIATISGRYYTMDRNKNFDRLEKSLDAMINGNCITAEDPLVAIEDQYQENLNDEHLKPIVLVDENKQAIAKIKEEDEIIFFNFRKDRAIQLAQSFTDLKIKEEEFKIKIPKVHFTAMTEYMSGLDMDVAFPPETSPTCLGKIISENKKKQLRIAETEKYAHVTYFFNVGEEKPFPGEERIVVPSKNVPSYDKIPEMSAPEITEKILIEIGKDKFDFILLNFANSDMVGHTGNVQATIKAVEIIDDCLKKIIATVLEKNGCLLITADHGNAEEMIDLRTGEKITEHSNNPVPCWLVTPENKRKRPLPIEPEIENGGMLCDLAPTILDLMGIEKDPKINCESLINSLK
ncbi:MAG: 2,3-bisphosphoglycerate-independent phosphoglycerate mutase [Patescibacteria group bacterium]|jgi:2,3-bisphosphoglycerate-independent phosphoglycerate mutase|nr:2,3-bisphosphoglycerate-independent phosphoglycerate mutase [Patescibacteria group bacterium]